jgi:hypothetical protein
MTEEDAINAHHYLKATDEECAELKSQVAYLDEMRKIIRAELFLEFEGTVAEREARAMNHPKYRDSVLALQVGTANYETMKNRRFTANQQIELWRTESANMRKPSI